MYSYKGVYVKADSLRKSPLLQLFCPLFSMFAYEHV